jgi:hypothetical protein
LANLPVEQSDFGVFHLLQGALSADFRQPSTARHKLAPLILRILVNKGILLVDKLCPVAGSITKGMMVSSGSI